MIQSPNDSRLDRFLAFLNGAGALIAGGFSVTALVDPVLVAGGADTPMARLYAGVYAARAVPLAVALLWALVRRSPALVPFLVVAGLAQVGDAVVGVGFGKANMIVGGTLLAVIHLGSAARLHDGTKSGSALR